MGTLNQALDSVTAAIKAGLSTLLDDVESHPGRFTEAELGRLVRRSHCVRVAVEQTPGLSVDGRGNRDFEVLFSAFIVCTDVKGADRHRAALDITEAVVDLLPFNCWGNKQQFRAVPPASINAENLYNGEIDKKGIALWAVSWTQTVKTI